jgi:hypothetical protein
MARRKRRNRNRRPGGRHGAAAAVEQTVTTGGPVSALWALVLAAVIGGGLVVALSDGDWVTGIASLTCRTTGCGPTVMAVAGWAVFAVVPLPFAVGALIRHDLNGWVAPTLTLLGIVLALPAIEVVVSDGLLAWMNTVRGWRPFALAVGRSGWFVLGGGMLCAVVLGGADRGTTPGRVRRIAGWTVMGLAVAGGLAVALTSA